MKLPSPLYQGKILKRYKRFFVDLEMDHGEIITAHCANTGPMTTCLERGWTGLVSHHSNPKRKLPYSLELIHNGNTFIGVHTGRANQIVYEALENKKIKALQKFDVIHPEYSIGDSRLDFMLSNINNENCFVEVKSVTLLGEKKVALFPDAVSERAQKHLDHLIEIQNSGHTAFMLFLVQREDVSSFSPAWDIDPVYASLLVMAKEKGVQIQAWQCHIDATSITLSEELPIILD